jgi:hypothetical protein
MRGRGGRGRERDVVQKLLTETLVCAKSAQRGDCLMVLYHLFTTGAATVVKATCSLRWLG